MQIEVININENPSRWDLVVQFFKLRKKVLADQKGWELDIFGNYECDPYDGFHATYVVAHDNNSVVGGGRLHRTTALGVKNIYSYMIRDAYKGILSGLPSNIADSEPPLHDAFWEFTRFISTEKNATNDIIVSAFNYVKSMEGTKCYHLGRPSTQRLGRNLGYETTPIGPVCTNNSGAMQAFCCEIS